MTPSDPLRSHLAPSNILEAIFVDQAVLASEEMAALSSRRPDSPDHRWLRHYSQAQDLFRRALADLEKIRKASPPPASTAFHPSPSPAGPAPSPHPIPAPLRRPSPCSTLPHVSATSAASPDQTPSSPPSDLPWPKPRNRYERRRLEALKRSAAPLAGSGRDLHPATISPPRDPRPADPPRPGPAGPGPWSPLRP